MRAFLHRPSLGLVAAALALAACSGGDEEAAAEPAPSVSPSPSPSETEPPPIAGERHVEATLVSHEHLLTQQAIPPPAEDAINVLLGQTAQLLDDHLNDLNDGGPGLLLDLAEDGLFPTEADAELLGAGLASPEQRAVAARYDLDVAYGGEPRWITVYMEVDREDGSTRTLDLVLTAEQPPKLIAAGDAA